MDTTKLINRIIQKYEDQPEIQADIRKVLGLAATEQKYFFRQFVRNEQRPEHATETAQINRLKHAISQENINE